MEIMKAINANNKNDIIGWRENNPGFFFLERYHAVRRSSIVLSDIADIFLNAASTQLLIVELCSDCLV